MTVEVKSTHGIQIVPATEPFDVAIGHALRGATNPLLAAGSAWFANPNRIGPEMPLDLSLRLYESLWRSRLAGTRRQMWRARLGALIGKRIGVTSPIQGRRAEVLVKLVEEFMP